MNNDNFLPLSLSVQNGSEPEPKITDFEQIDEIGVGGYGRVNLYKHKVTGGIYAIKLIDKTKFENKIQKQLFAREVEIMYKISHKNIVKLYSHFEDESNCYLVMEYLKRGNLYSLLQSQPNKCLDQKSIANYIVDLISSLYYLHNMNPSIIHRDIKPENLLLSDDNHLKLTDFGGSNYYFQNKARFTTVGTRIYQSPEMLLNKGYDTRVDIWAIGVLIFELLSGEPPFKKDTHSIEDNIINLRINWPNKMNLLGKNLISKILKVNPEGRLNLVEILQHKFISDIVPDASKRLILPSDFTIEPFIISKMTPQEKTKVNERDYGSNYSDKNSEINFNEDSKKSFEKLNESNNNLTKMYNDVLIKKKMNKNENENAKSIEYLKQKVEILQKEIYNKIEINLNQAKQISLLEEDNKYLLQKIDTLTEKYENKEKQYLSVIQKLMEKIKYNKDNKESPQIKRNNQNTLDEFFTNKSHSVKDLQDIPNYYNDNLLLFYQKENKKLNEINDKYLNIINELKEKIVKLETNSISNEVENEPMFKLLKENEEKIEKKEKKINKFKNILENISNFIDKINYETFQVDIPFDHFDSFDSNNLSWKNGNYYKSSSNANIQFPNNNLSQSNEILSFPSFSIQSKSKLNNLI